MPITPNLARDYTLSVSSAGSTFTTVSGVANLKISTSKKDTDITTYDNNGINVKLPVSFDGEMVAEIIEQYDTGTTPYVQDAGQKIILAADAQLGFSSRLYWRLVSKNPTLHSGAINGTGFVMIDENGGGGNDDVEMIKVKFTFDARPVGSGEFVNKHGSQ